MYNEIVHLYRYVAFYLIKYTSNSTISLFLIVVDLEVSNNLNCLNNNTIL